MTDAVGGLIKQLGLYVQLVKIIENHEVDEHISISMRIHPTSNLAIAFTPRQSIVLPPMTFYGQVLAVAYHLLLSIC